MIHKSLLHILTSRRRDILIPSAHWQVRFSGPRPTSRPAGPRDLILVVSEVGPVFHDLRDDVGRETIAAAKKCREHGSVSLFVGRKAAGGVHGS